MSNNSPDQELSRGDGQGQRAHEGFNFPEMMNFPFIPFLPARAPYVRLSLSALSWLGGPTTCPPPWVWFGCPEP